MMPTSIEPDTNIDGLLQIDFETHPSKYRHWELEIEDDRARLTMNVNEEQGLRPDDYVLTLTSQYEAMNVEQIDAAADEVLRPHQLIWLIVGDLVKIEKSIRALGIAEVEILEL